MSSYTIIDEIFHMYGSYGHALYIGEPVSISEHMLQTAYEAEKDGASVISSSLLCFGLLCWPS